MKKIVIIILSCCFSTLSFGQLLNPQPKEMTEKFFPDLDVELKTTAFKKEKGFTKYDEMMAFLKPIVDQNSDLIKMSFVGESQKGLKVPMLYINKDNDIKDKVKVWLQGGLHGDEPASTEGILWLIHQLFNTDKYEYLLDKLEIGIIPMANVDGYNIQLRDAVNGLDLNRDQTKLNIKESKFLKQSFTDFEPDVAVDFHEYRAFRRDFVHFGEYGVTNPNDVMFLYSGNLNVPKNLRDFTQNTFVNNAKNALKEKDLRVFNYFSTSDCQGYTCFNMGSINARASASSYALANTISTLVEVRGVALGRTSFKRRTMTTFWTAVSYLETAHQNHDQVKKVIKTAISSNHDVVAKSKRSVSKYNMPMIDIASNAIIKPEIILRNALESQAVLSRERPTAYLILPEEKELVKKLKILGLHVQKLQEDKSITVESFKVTEYYKDLHKYEGVHRQEISTAVTTLNKEFPEGTSIVYLDQRFANLAVATLEPEAPNSFISFNVLTTALGQELPYYRYMKSKKFN